MRMIGFWAGLAALVGSNAPGANQKPQPKPFDDTAFVQMAASAGMEEVALGKIGTEKAKTADVKKFAERMVTDHSKGNDELKAAAKEAGVAVPEQMSAEAQKHVAHFKDYKGDNFDRDFMQHMVKDHEAAVALFTQASKEAKNKSLRDFATKVLPTLQSHLTDAKKISKE
jgi:putative membrane protein